MEQSYLWGEKGIQINAMMTATAWNLKKMMEKIKQEFLFFILRCIFPIRQTFNVSPPKCEFLRIDNLQLFN